MLDVMRISIFKGLKGINGFTSMRRTMRTALVSKFVSKFVSK